MSWKRWENISFGIEMILISLQYVLPADGENTTDHVCESSGAVEHLRFQSDC